MGDSWIGRVRGELRAGIDDESFDLDTACRLLLGRPPRDVWSTAWARAQETGRWPSGFVELRVAHAVAVQNAPATLDEVDRVWLFRVMKAAWRRESIWLRPPAVSSWEDIWPYICTCDGYEWLIAKGVADYEQHLRAVLGKLDADSAWQLPFADLRAAQFVLGRAWRFGGGWDLGAREADRWLRLHSALRQAWLTQIGAAGTSFDAFPPDVVEKLGAYVYLLKDPRDGEIFYVGKGTGNRVFAHARDALGSTEVTPKLDRIRSVLAAGDKVSTELVRFGLNASTAFEVEAAAIQLLGMTELLNAVEGHGSLLRGRMRTDDAISLFAAQPVEIEVPAILIRPSRLWYPAMPAADVYEATRGWWTVGERREGAHYALTVAHGVIRAVWKITAWRRQQEGDRGWYDVQGAKPRWGFDGTPAPELQHYVNGSVRHYWKAGAQLPFTYVHC